MTRPLRSPAISIAGAGRRTRRQILRSGLAAGAGALAAGLASRPAAAIGPIARPGTTGGHLKLALAAYSFRSLLTGRSGAPPRWTFFDLLERAAGWGTDGVELTEYYFEKPITSEYLTRLKRTAHLLGQTITGTPIGNTFTHPPGEARERELKRVRDWIDVSADLGSPCIRVFAGSAPRGISEAEARRNVVACLESAGEHAAKRGVFLALENHGGVVATADGLLEIVRTVRSPWVAVNLDTGNFRSADPYADLAAVAPYAVAVQYKVEVVISGRRQPADPARVARILGDANYRGFVALEYEAAEDPLAAVPRHLEALRKALG
jgi:sugar phosphate isomerase/epimerase